MLDKDDDMTEPSKTDNATVVHLPLLPTGKPHISFSELAVWLDCPFRHKLAYIDKLGTFEGNEHTFFGTHVHSGCETFIKTGVVHIDEVLASIDNTWDSRGFLDKDVWMLAASSILTELPSWLDNTFEDWKPIDAEHVIYEPLTHIGHPDVKWKGMIDAVISHRGPRGKDIVRIMDWKTTSWGWARDKQRDFKVNAQAAAYKIFWSTKFDIPLKDIRANFVLLKRSAKDGARCQSIEVSVGPSMVKQVNTSIDKMLRAVKASYAPKNKLSCKYCEFNATEHCEGVGNRLK